MGSVDGVVEVRGAPLEESRRPRRGLPSLFAVWLFAAALGASLLWAVPQAQESGNLEGELASLERQVSAERSLIEDATARLSALRGQTAGLRSRQHELLGRVRADGDRITALQLRIKQMKAARHAASAEPAKPPCDASCRAERASPPKPPECHFVSNHHGVFIPGCD